MHAFEPSPRPFPGRLLARREGQAIQAADTGKRPRTVETGEAAASESVAAAFGLAPSAPVLQCCNGPGGSP